MLAKSGKHVIDTKLALNIASGWLRLGDLEFVRVVNLRYSRKQKEIIFRTTLEQKNAPEFYRLMSQIGFSKQSTFML